MRRIRDAVYEPTNLNKHVNNPSCCFLISCYHKLLCCVQGKSATEFKARGAYVSCYMTVSFETKRTLNTFQRSQKLRSEGSSHLVTPKPLLQLPPVSFVPLPCAVMAWRKIIWSKTKIQSIRQLSCSGLKWTHICRTITIQKSSVKVRVICPGGGRGGEVISDWSKMQDGRWKAVFWLDNNSRWQLSLWLDKNSRWQMEKQSSDWTIIQDGGWNRTGLNKMKFSDWPKFKFKFSLM